MAWLSGSLVRRGAVEARGGEGSVRSTVAGTARVGSLAGERRTAVRGGGNTHGLDMISSMEQSSTW